MGVELTEKQVAEFRDAIMTYYDKHGRHELPWRVPQADGTFDPYKIWVSELMLQQTQVVRVIPKYEAFLRRFPDVRTLADANLGEILVAWQGLGYNRRAKFLWQAAQLLMREHKGTVPATTAELLALPGIGRNTAGAILAYAYNQSAVFVETNVRSAYFHHFFYKQTNITDKEVAHLIGQTMTAEPRIFYWALMDYGSYLKRLGHGSIGQSKHYVKQAKFEGSTRQIRGQVLRLLAQHTMTLGDLLDMLADDRSLRVIETLEREGMIGRTGQTYQLT